MVGTFSKMRSIILMYHPIGPESCGIIKPPNVIPVSYLQDEATASLAYARRQCWEYAKVRYICDQLFIRCLRFTAWNDGDICSLL